MFGRFGGARQKFYNFLLHSNYLVSAPCSTSSADRTAKYVQNFFENQLLPSDSVKYDCKKDLSKQIYHILERFDYEIYKQNVFPDEKIESSIDRISLELKPQELFEILCSKNETESQKLLRYYAVSKCQIRENYLEKLKSSAEREKLKAEKFADNLNRSGIWRDQNLEYGLWHNCLFTKMKCSSRSHLFDRRLLNASLIPTNPRLLIDLNFVPINDFFKTKKVFTDLLNLLAFNKYRSKQPFTIEFIKSKSEDKKSEQVLSKFFTWWNNPSQYQYNVHRINSLENSGSTFPESAKFIYLSPNAKKAISIAELLDYQSIFVIPAYISRNFRDPVYDKINSLTHFPLKQQILVRRLPTFEFIVWKHFHGVLQWSIVFSILHDMRFNVEDDWNTVFKRYLLNSKHEFIKSDEELQSKLRERLKSRDKRAEQIENFLIKNQHKQHRPLLDYPNNVSKTNTIKSTSGYDNKINFLIQVSECCQEMALKLLFNFSSEIERIVC